MDSLIDEKNKDFEKNFVVNGDNEIGSLCI
jgi:hypothetical protein